MIRYAIMPVGKTHAGDEIKGFDVIGDGSQSIEIKCDGNKLWVNVDGLCSVRIANVKGFEFEGPVCMAEPARPEGTSIDAKA